MLDALYSRNFIQGLSREKGDVEHLHVPYSQTDSGEFLSRKFFNDSRFDSFGVA